MSYFRYFPRFPEDARLGATVCAYCGRSPAIPAIRLQADTGDGSRKAACGDCLQAGRARTSIPAWIQDALAQAVAVTHSDWSQEWQAAYVVERVAELSSTPPVAWIQNNEWPICGDDFAVFAGELSQAGLLHAHGSAERSREALLNIIKAVTEWALDADDAETVWEQLGNFVAVYVFRCPNSQEDMYVLQTA